MRLLLILVLVLAIKLRSVVVQQKLMLFYLTRVTWVKSALYSVQMVYRYRWPTLILLVPTIALQAVKHWQ